jgi:hypothetical protein
MQCPLLLSYVSMRYTHFTVNDAKKAFTLVTFMLRKLFNMRISRDA